MVVDYHLQNLKLSAPFYSLALPDYVHSPLVDLQLLPQGQHRLALL